MEGEILSANFGFSRIQGSQFIDLSQENSGIFPISATKDYKEGNASYLTFGRRRLVFSGRTKSGMAFQPDSGSRLIRIRRET